MLCRSESATPLAIYGIELDPIFDLLTDFGFSSQYRGTLRGISGDNHQFEIVSKKDRIRLVFAFMPACPEESELLDLALVKLRAIVYDCSPEVAFVISASKAGKKLKELSNYYHFKLLDPREITEKLQENLSSL